MALRVSWDQVFAWRMRRQFVDARGGSDAVEVVARLAGVQAQVTSAAETAVALRSATGKPGAVVQALGERKLVKTWAMRGTLHALTPDIAAGALSLMGSARTWEKPSWAKTFGATPEDVAALVEVEGRSGYVLTEHAEELAATAPAHSVRLLGSFDQYVLGPGTGDTALLSAEHRAKVSRAAGWISPLVLVDGRIANTWEIVGDELVVAMFDDAHPPLRELRAEAAHIARATGKPALTVRG